MSRTYSVDDVANIIMGGFIEGSKTEAILSSWHADRKKENRSASTKFNAAIRQHSPSLALLDPEVIAIEVYNAIIEEPNKYVYVVTDKEGPSFNGDKGFAEHVDHHMTTIGINFVSNLTKNIHAALTSTAALPTISVAELQTTLEIISSSINLIDDRQNSVAKAGANLRSTLAGLGTRRVPDIGLLFSNTRGRVGILSKSFNVGRADVNAIIQTVALAALKQIKVEPTAAFLVGNIVHAGHVGLYDPSKQLIGINTPGVITAGLGSGRFAAVEQAVGNIQLHIDYGLTVDTEYSGLASLLLSLGFNVSISMSGVVNSGILSAQETAAIKTSLEKLSIDAINKLLEEKVGTAALTNLVPNIRKSPTIIEHIKESVRCILEGILPPIQIGSKSSKRKLHSTKKSPNTGVKQVKSSKGVAPAPKKILPSKPKAQAPQLSLTSLQNLLNYHLQDVISANMGDGNSKNVLNYRTGRFAASAKVEKLSQSKEGMITAFYSAMRNPYYTFSNGGRQQNPKSRDPKLLISKSIHEIAATATAARMRAVSV